MRSDERGLAAQFLRSKTSRGLLELGLDLFDGKPLCIRTRRELLERLGIGALAPCPVKAHPAGDIGALEALPVRKLRVDGTQVLRQAGEQTHAVHREACAVDCGALVPALEERACVDLAFDQQVALAQGGAVVRLDSPVGLGKLDRQAVDGVAAQGGGPLHHLQVVGDKQDARASAAHTGGCTFLPVDLVAALSLRHGQLVGDAALFCHIHELGLDAGRWCVPAHDLGPAGLAKGLPRRQQLYALDDVGLANGVGADEHDEVPQAGKLQVAVTAIFVEAYVVDRQRHCATQPLSQADRHGEV